MDECRQVKGLDGREQGERGVWVWGLHTYVNCNYEHIKKYVLRDTKLMDVRSPA